MTAIGLQARAGATTGGYALSSEDLRRTAVATLVRNWRGRSTVPTPSLYPHQWSWDSAFNAVGWAHVSPRRAWTELSALLGAQWRDGRVPQIVFDPAVAEDAYFPGPWFWRPLPADGPPRGVVTSGLVQPPVHAGAALTVARRSPGPESAAALRRLYPRLVRWHDYLWSRRRAPEVGLVAIVHPWESGLDNSPTWDAPLRAVPARNVTEVAGHRRDLLHAGSAHRPTHDDYARYVLLVRDYRDGGYRDTHHSLRFYVVDPLMNAVLAWSERALAAIARIVGADPQPHLDRAREITQLMQEHLWSPAAGCFTAMDALTGAPIRTRTVGGLAPLLLPDLDAAIRETLVATLTGPAFGLGDGVRGVPSYDLTAPDLDRQRYWRGPTWASTNWLVWQGLQTAERHDLAGRLAADMVGLVAAAGLREYFDPITGAGLGGTDFTWTAAVLLDMLPPPSAATATNPIQIGP
ncbi:Trehalase [Micromonospora rhizosphaerae]|uniref:Trehalase n=1 Tax=Micromonospora rhizosphaerae TaxID=568872 RepID=A0A1C6T1L5_9ACTN|nr:trehalase family glycosidase [Micromonospora rhizosphaerae]SCL35658.1 Trehalase [Micromonospora rhizosphaerae]